MRLYNLRGGLLQRRKPRLRVENLGHVAIGAGPLVQEFLKRRPSLLRLTFLFQRLGQMVSGKRVMWIQSEHAPVFGDRIVRTIQREIRVTERVLELVSFGKRR